MPARKAHRQIGTETGERILTHGAPVIGLEVESSDMMWWDRLVRRGAVEADTADIAVAATWTTTPAVLRLKQ